MPRTPDRSDKADLDLDWTVLIQMNPFHTLIIEFHRMSYNMTYMMFYWRYHLTNLLADFIQPIIIFHRSFTIRSKHFAKPQ